MNPFRAPPTQDDEELLLRPRSRWPLRIAIAFMIGFVAFVYYGMYEAFGSGALIATGPLAMLILAVAAMRRTDPRWLAKRSVQIEQQATRRQLADPNAPWPKTPPFLG